jgi:ribosome-associated translation inhibitor RaiA
MNVLIESSRSGEPQLWRQQVEQRVRLVLQRLQGQVQQARISLRDINGPKGGVDKQCQIMLTTAGHGQLVIVAKAEDAQGALNQALQRATHSLARLWQRKRRPLRQPGLA